MKRARRSAGQRFAPVAHEPVTFPAASCPDADSETHFLLTMLWSADAALAARADRAGVDRIGIDLETLGKAERQRGLGTLVSTHRMEDLASMRRAVTRGERFGRVNPLHDGSGG